MPLNNLITFRKGSQTEWTNPGTVLSSGEPGFDTTNSIFKIGDGTSTWNDLLNKAIFSNLDLANSLGDIVTFSVDANLGDLVVDVDGSEKVRVDTNGQVGIGTDSPDGKLHVLGDTYQQGSLYISNSSPLGALTYNRIYSGGSDNFIIQGGGTSLTLSGQGGSATLNASSTNVTIGNR